MLKIKEAFLINKKGKGSRALGHFNTQVEESINEQIDLKTLKLKEIEKSFAQKGEENFQDLVDNLVSIDEERIQKRESRVAYANQYRSEGIKQLKENKEFLESLRKEKDILNKDVALLNEFKALLTSLPTHVSVEEEEVSTKE